jgi:hypothetical protein
LWAGFGDEGQEGLEELGRERGTSETGVAEHGVGDNGVTWIPAEKAGGEA